MSTSISSIAVQCNEAQLVASVDAIASPEIAVSVRNLGKSYRLWNNPQDRLKQPLRSMFSRWLPIPHKQYFNEFWALRDISFDVKKGETLGIVGRNGSGKSTLLQILCGTLTPTCGAYETRGRVAALLELGSGFNPEFTGHDNVYMNASILGLTKDEIDERYESIVEFADIGQFIDQPVKTYSSGMYVRLAFAVIAHVDAEILVIDEALSVGDAVFTQKCMRFLRKFMAQGTVIFVSHDTSSVVNLCKSAIWLDKGEIRQFADAKTVTQVYVQSNYQELCGNDLELKTLDISKDTADVHVPCVSQTVDPETQVHFFDSLSNSTGWKTGVAEIVFVSFRDIEGKPVNTLVGGENVRLAIRAIAISDLHSPILGFLVKDRLGQNLFGENTFIYVNPPLVVSPGQSFEAQFLFQIPMLPNGDYSLTVSVAEGTPWDHVQHHWIHDAVILKVSSNKLRHGLVGIPFKDVFMKIVQTI